MIIFNDIYYSFSPMIADLERNLAFKESVPIAITPIISSLAILNHVDIDSESEVLVYGFF
jgi:peptidyl-prolyl cis-trans isomerase B (cyclophilin B)